MVSRRNNKKAKQKAQKRSLSQHIKSLPPELQGKVDDAVEELMAETSANRASPTTPLSSPTQVNVKVKIDAEQVKAEKKEKDVELKVDKDLLNAIKKLTEQFDAPKRKEEGGIKGFLKNKIAAVKESFTLEGAAGMMGVRRDDGSLKGAILGSMLQKSDRKAEKAKFISNFGMFTEQGRNLKGEELAKEGSKRFEVLSKLRDKKTALEQKAAAARAFGGELSEADKLKLSQLSRGEKRVSGLLPVKATQKPTSNTREDLLTGAKEGIAQSIAEATPEEKQALRDMDPEKLRGIFRGALEELVNISDDQLKMLEKMASSMPTEEDRLEAKRKETAEPIKERATEKVVSNDGSIVSSIFDALSSRFPGLASAGKTIFGAGKAIAKGAGKAISGAVSGTIKAGKAILSGGQAIASGASKAISSGAGTAAKRILGKLGPIAMAGMAAYDGIQGYQSASENLGIEGREATTGEKLSSAAGGIASGLTFGLVDEKVASKGIASFFGAGPEKQATPTRVAQSAELAVKREEQRILELKKEKGETPSAIINNAPTSIITNKTTNVQRLSVRNVEPTVTGRMRAHFA